jgi:hypothetical protein
MTNGNGVSRGDRNRNARLARLRELVPLNHAIVAVDLADKKQMVVVTDHDSKVLARKTFRCRAWDLGVALDWAAQRAADSRPRATVPVLDTPDRYRLMALLAAGALFPTCGVAPEPKEWSPEETAAVVGEFFASPFGAPLDRVDERNLLESVLWFSTGYATGDPWRWSPVTVEMLLADWFPRKVIAEPAYLAKVPDLLRAYVRYCHDRNKIRSQLTEGTLAAVDQYEPEYLQLIHSDRQESMAGLAEAILESARLKHLSDEEIHLEYIADEVGGVKTLMALDAEPLPDGEFDWTGVPEEIHPAVQAILDEWDACADAVLDVEHRTAMRRFLARAARNDPTLFRRKGSPVRGAAATAWVICTANRTIGSYRSPMTGKDLLLAHFGVTGSVSDRAQSLVRAAGIDLNLTYGSLRVGDPGLLVSGRRRELVEDRDRTLATD